MGELTLLPAVRKADAGHVDCRRPAPPAATRSTMAPAREAISCCARAGDESPMTRRVEVWRDAQEKWEEAQCRCRCCRPRWSAPTPSRNG
jgi:hypothetical protein